MLKKANNSAESSSSTRVPYRCSPLSPRNVVGTWLSLNITATYVCSLCSRAFPSSQALGGHQNAHRKERNDVRLQYIRHRLETNKKIIATTTTTTTTTAAATADGSYPKPDDVTVAENPGLGGARGRSRNGSEKGPCFDDDDKVAVVVVPRPNRKRLSSSSSSSYHPNYNRKRPTGFLKLINNPSLELSLGVGKGINSTNNTINYSSTATANAADYYYNDDEVINSNIAKLDLTLRL